MDKDKGKVNNENKECTFLLIYDAINSQGFLIVAMAVFGFLTYLAYEEKNLFGILLGGFFLGSLLTAIIQEVMDYVLDRQ